MRPFSFLNQPNVVPGGGGGGGANLNLSNLTISSGTLVPVFASGSTSYTVSVPNGVTSVTLTPTTAGSATITVQGLPVASGAVSGAINLPVGSTAISVITDGGGGNTATYTVTVTRAAAAGNNPPNPSLLDYDFHRTGGLIEVAVSVSNPNTQDMVVSFNAWAVPRVSWVTAFPLTIPAGATVQVRAKRAYNIFGGVPPSSGTVGGTWTCGSDSGTMAATAKN